jgi:hypothetical protein
MKKTFIFTGLIFLLPIMLFGQSRCLTPEFEQARKNLYQSYGGAKEADGTRSEITTHLVGDTVTFWAWDLTRQPPVWIRVPATCRAVTAYSYVFVADDQWNVNMDTADVEQVAYYWEEGTYNHPLNGGIYFLDTSNFGNPPDQLDSDDHIYILYDDLGSYHGTVFDGYFSVFNEYTEQQARGMGGHSNEVEMFYMSCSPGDPVSPIRISVLSHEFEHMIHWAHDADEETWVDEGCAEYAMLLFGVPDPLIDFPNQPDNDLISWGSGFAEYVQTFMFFTYLADHYGGSGILALTVDDPLNSIDGIDNALINAGYDATFADVFNNWVIANYYHGAGGDTLVAPDSLYLYFSIDPPPFRTVDIINQYPAGPLDRLVGRWSADYIRFNNPGGAYQELSPSFTGNMGVSWRLALLTDSLASDFSIERFEPVAGIWRDTVADFGQSTNAVLVVTPMNTNGSSSYTIRADASLSIADQNIIPSEISIGPLYPNPFNQGVLISYSLGSSGSGGLDIFDITGRLINNITLLPANHQVAWDGRDIDGKNVTSGTYLFRISNNESFGVIRGTLLK